MRSRHTFTFAIPVLLVALACASEPADEAGTMSETEDTAAVTDTETTADPAAADAALRQFTVDYTARYNAGDAAGVAALYADDGILIGSSGEPVEGPAAIEANQTEGMQAFPALDATVTETETMGDAAIARGTYTLSGGENGAEIGGHWMANYELGADGQWKLRWLMVNDTTPATETTTTG